MRLAIRNCNVTMLAVTLQYRFTSLYAQQMYTHRWTGSLQLTGVPIVTDWWALHAKSLCFVTDLCIADGIGNRSCSVYCICVLFHNHTHTHKMYSDLLTERQSEVCVWEKTYHDKERRVWRENDCLLTYNKVWERLCLPLEREAR